MLTHIVKHSDRFVHHSPLLCIFKMVKHLGNGTAGAEVPAAVYAQDHNSSKVTPKSKQPP